MTSPRRIYRIYHYLGQNAETVRDFSLAQGQPVSGTVERLIAKDRAKLLSRFGEEMAELCGVLDGTHDDSYLMEASQTWYWASLYAVTGGAAWEDLGQDDLPRLAVQSGIGSTEELRRAVTRLVELGPEQVKPAKPFLLWWAADRLYRQATPIEKQWSADQIMAADLADMKKRPYLEPVLRAVPE